MGCLNSTPAKGDAKASGAGATPANNNQREFVSSLDPPPDFGLGDQYEVRKLLGEGGSGQTWLCRDVQQRKMVAIKFIKRAIPKIVLPMLMHEIKIQAELGDGHVNLVSAKAVVLTDTHLGIVMEYAAGGNLTNYVTEKWDTAEERGGLMLSEDEARYFFQQYINAVEFLHSNHVAHRDLKLDNIVLDGSNPPRIKVCDFGFSKNWEDDVNMFTQIGTPVYMCPQLISCKQNGASYDATKADIWACGVLLFVMLLGMFPYDHTEHPDPNSSDAHMEVWLQQVKYNWRDSPPVTEFARKLSLECQDLLDKMFERDEKRRVTIARIKEHRWYKKKVPEDLQLALDKIAEEQSQRVSTSGRRAGRALNKKRDAQLHSLLEEAGHEESNAGGQPTFKRVDLTRLYDPDSDDEAGPSTSTASSSAKAPAAAPAAAPASPKSGANADGASTTAEALQPAAGAAAAAEPPASNHASSLSADARAATGSATEPAEAFKPDRAPSESRPRQNGSAAQEVATDSVSSAPDAIHGSNHHSVGTAAGAPIASDDVTLSVATKEEQCAQAVINSEVPSVKAVAAAQ